MDIRAITEDELSAWRDLVVTNFGADPSLDPHGAERLRATLDVSRAFAAFDRGTMVGTAGGFDFELALPGGRLPMSGLTMVSVRSTHRRRGILRALMAEHLAAARAHGDPVSGLWASESTIYGRFGYGLAAESDALGFSAAGASVADGMALDEVDIVSDEEAGGVMPAVYERVFASRPGLFSRSAAWWRYRRVMDRADLRSGGGPRRFAVVRRGDGVSGYVLYRQRLAWDYNLAAGTLDLEELCAVDARAEATLWRFLASVDLFPRLSWSNAPTDCLLPWLVGDRRRVIRRRVEALWLRIDDVPRTLAARGYASDGALTLRLGEGIGETCDLVVDGGRVSCGPSDREPELTLDRQSLGSLLLGGFSATQLARAGRIVAEPATLALADRMFASPLAPWCPEIF